MDGHLRVGKGEDGLSKTLVLGQGGQDEFVRQSVGNESLEEEAEEGWDQLVAAVTTRQ